MKTNNIDDVISQLLAVIPEIAEQLEREVRSAEVERAKKRAVMKRYMERVDLVKRIDEAIAARQKIINRAKGEVLCLQKKRKAVESEIADAVETLKSLG